MYTSDALGSVLRNLRNRHGWSLKEMSSRTGIATYTLSKIDHGRSTLSYPALAELCNRLEIAPSDLFPLAGNSHLAGKGRMSTGRSRRSVEVPDRYGRVELLCADLRHKRMIPSVTTLRACSVADAGGLARHPGEEFLYVLAGRIQMHSECYRPAAMAAGDCIYFDASMAHACTLAPDCPEATVLSIHANHH